MQKNQKGFTIIELIVVIAIIAVLATIVMINVTQYIAKGKNAAIQGNLSSMMTSGATYFDGVGSYASFCASSGTLTFRDAIQGVTGLAASNYTSNSEYYSCNVKSDNTGWCACSQLLPVGTTGTTFCIDSTGAKKTSASATSCATSCPAAGACQ